MSTKEIKIILCSELPTTPDGPVNLALIDLLVDLTNKIDALEDAVKRIDRTASRAANVASCLANGIKPD